MNINLHIERLILDGLNIDRGHGALLRQAVVAELSRLFSQGGLAPSFTSGGALTKIRTSSIGFNGNESPLRLGQEIARSLYGGIGESK
jgi:hypothetical protein